MRIPTQEHPGSLRHGIANEEGDFLQRIPVDERPLRDTLFLSRSDTLLRDSLL
jgi:hypothetical protein